MSDAHNHLAWLLATCPKDAFRNGAKAVEHARRAAVLSNWKDPGVLDSLAAAYAEAGDFDSAVKWQNQALSFADYEKAVGDEGRARLQLYIEHKPYRDMQQTAK